MMKLVACVAIVCSLIIGACADYSARSLAGSFGITGTTDGQGSAARFNKPTSVFLQNSLIYVADTGSSTIRQVAVTSANTLTWAGKANTPGFENGKSNIISGTGAGTARFNASCDVTIDSTGNIFVADTNNHVIRKISPAGDVTTVAGNGTAGHADGAAGSAMFRFPTRLVVASSGDLYVSDSGNHVIRKIASGSLTVSTFAGNGTQAAVNATEAAGYVDATGAEAKFSNPNGIALDFDGAVYVADTDNNVIRMISTSGEVTTLAGNGTAGFLNDAVKKAMFNRPQGVTVDMAKNVFVADTNNHMFRKITFNGEVQTLSGLAGQSGAADGDLKTAKYNYPKSIMVQQSTFYVADTENSVVRVLTTTTKPSVVSNVTVIAKTATSVTLSWTAPSDGGSTIQTYTVGYGTLNGDLTSLPVPSGNTYTVTNLIPNSVYRFQVAASNYVGQGDWSSLITTQTPVGATSAPTGVVVSSADAPSSSSATISWTTPTALNGAPITGYVVSWVNTNTQLTTSANTTSTNTTYTITGLTAFTTYSVSVQATNSAGNSTASTPVSVRLQHKAFTYYPGGGFCNSTTYSPLGTVSRMHAKCTTANCALVDPTSLNSTLYSQQCFSNVPTPTNNTDNVQLAYYSNNGACSGVAYSAYFSYRQSGACVPNTITNSGGYVYVTCTSAHFCTDSDCKSCAAASSWSATKTCNSLNGGSASYSLFCAYRSASAAVVPSVFITLALILVALF